MTIKNYILNNKIYQTIFQTKLKYLVISIFSYIGLVCFLRLSCFLVGLILKNKKVLISQDDLIEHKFLTDKNDKNFEKYKITLEKLKKFHISLEDPSCGILPSFRSAVPYKIDENKEYLYLITNKHCVQNSSDFIKNYNGFNKLIFQIINLILNIFFWTNLVKFKLNFENNKDLESILIKNQKPEILRSKDENKDFAILKLKIDPKKKCLITDEFIKENFPKFDHNENFNQNDIYYSVSSSNTFNNKNKIVGTVVNFVKSSEIKGNLFFGASGSCIYDEDGNVIMQINSGDENKDKNGNRGLYGISVEDINKEAEKLISGL